MPELPEVETIRRGLEKYLVGKVIEDVEVRLAKQITGDVKSIKGAKIQKVRRYGKGLVIDLDNGYSLAIHVKMTGQLIYQDDKVLKVTKATHPKVGDLPGKATHVIFQLRAESLGQRAEQKPLALSPKPYASKAYLYYNDVRQFGWIKIVKTDALTELPFFKNLGPEFLDSLTIEQFSNALKTTKTPIKIVLLDQSRFAGAGNIYVNDALYRAKIHPQRPASSLSVEEVKQLFKSIEVVLKKGIEVGGSSEQSYVNALGEEGAYQKIVLVYGKVGKPCQRCGSIIQRIKIGGRGTFYCPTCQK